MKNFLIIAIIFILSSAGVFWLFNFVSTINHETASTQTTGSALQSAVTFGGVNILAVFISILLAVIITTVLFFTIKSRRSN